MSNQRRLMGSARVNRITRKTTRTPPASEGFISKLIISTTARVQTPSDMKSLDDILVFPKAQFRLSVTSLFGENQLWGCVVSRAIRHVNYLREKWWPLYHGTNLTYEQWLCTERWASFCRKHCRVGRLRDPFPLHVNTVQIDQIDRLSFWGVLTVPHDNKNIPHLGQMIYMIYSNFVF